ncbi:MAG: Mg2+/Co2+ transporter [Elusimicrobia bacterium GWA2_69_24]|nr:MAG: Mg2+/Co2+ transporter [Elusimicrobia bacterium GWA2_69_24]HBL17464.1 Mg2+/Co2+ transporter [Elusimicrobiota bacterium]
MSLLSHGRYRPSAQALEFLKYIGPGLLVTVGFIDPGNWGANVAAGAAYGYTLLWMVTLSTLMLIVLQHNSAHLGIASGLCLSEAATAHLPRWVSRAALSTAMLAAVATAMAELLGAAIALRMLFHIPLALGALLTLLFSCGMLVTNSYRKIEGWIMAFVSLIGISFVVELFLVDVAWGQAVRGWVTPAFPAGSVPIIMSVLGAVVMPHNLFLHSEVIQSRQWNREGDAVIARQLRFEFLDTLFSMGIGWAINSAMILLAAATFFARGVAVETLEVAQAMLSPIAGDLAAFVFALALLFSGLASSITAGMAGGSIFAGMSGEPYNVADRHSRVGVLITLAGGALAILFVTDPLRGLIGSQIALSVQLPITVFLQIYLTSSEKVMGRYANGRWDSVLLWGIGLVVAALNVLLLADFLQ